jgi:hypothetical protein
MVAMVVRRAASSLRVVDGGPPRSNAGYSDGGRVPIGRRCPPSPRAASAWLLSRRSAPSSAARVSSTGTTISGRSRPGRLAWMCSMNRGGGAFHGFCRFWPSLPNFFGSVQAPAKSAGERGRAGTAYARRATPAGGAARGVDFPVFFPPFPPPAAAGRHPARTRRRRRGPWPPDRRRPGRR